MKLLRAAALAVVLLAAGDASADQTMPALLTLTEVAPGQYDVRWKVPRRGNRVLAIRPVLPDVFRPVGAPEVELTPSGQVTRFSVRADPWSLPGREIRVEGLASALVDTLVRFRFADGTVVTRILPPDRPTCEWPTRAGPASGPSRVAPAMAARSTVTSGALHVLTGLTHLVFLLGVALAARVRSALAAISFFAAGHVLGVLAGVAGVAVPTPPAEALLGVAGSVAAALALRGESRGIRPLAGIAGVVHGAALASGSGGAPLLPLLGVTLGVDAVQVLLISVAAAVLANAPLRRAAAYAVGVAGVALALASVADLRVAAPRGTAPSLLAVVLPPAQAGAQESVPVAAPTDAPLSVFLQLDPFETRLEAVLRVRDVPGLELREVIAVEEQEDVERRVADLVAASVEVWIDGARVEPALARIDFVTRSASAVTERPARVPEPLDEALLGLVRSYPTRRMPGEVSVRWGLFVAGAPAPLTIVDPEKTFTREIGPDSGEATWRNDLRSPPVISIESVRQRHPEVGVSVISLALLGLSIALAVILGRRGRGLVATAVVRALLAAACAVAPVLPVTVPLPERAQPDEGEAAGIVEALLANVHRAFEHGDEGEIYDRLAVSVVGDELRRVYLDHRQTMELAKLGGARARADSVEVSEVRRVEPVPGGGFRAATVWQVGGFVVHFGHRHFRQNRYEALVTVVPEVDDWKILRIEVAEKRRVR